MFIDTHCHLEKEYYQDINKVIEENRKSNILKIIVSGCSLETIDEVISYTNKYEDVYATIGFHPDQVLNVTDENLEELEEKIKINKKVIGVGEIGLDYHYSKENRNKQLILFNKQLSIAERLNLPVVIHSRDALEDTINTLKNYNLKGVIHCFTGSLETANIYIKMGYKLGIGGVLTFKNSNLYKVIEKISIENIVFETDSPYLAPEPLRGSINTSKNINLIAQRVAYITGKNLTTISEIVLKTTNDLFDLGN